MISIHAKRIRLDGDARLRDIKGDPFIFINLRTYGLVIIPEPEGSIEKQILRLVMEKIKNGSTFSELMDLVSKKFSLGEEETKEGLIELIQRLLEANMLRVES